MTMKGKRKWQMRSRPYRLISGSLESAAHRPGRVRTPMAGADHNLLIVSDLHISEGFMPSSGKWSRNEDFLSDDSFAAFLQYHEERRGDGLPWRLIIAGDVFDFLQVTSQSPANWEKLR